MILERINRSHHQTKEGGRDAHPTREGGRDARPTPQCYSAPIAVFTAPMILPLCGRYSASSVLA